MSFFKKSIYQQIKIFYLPLTALLLTIFILSSNLYISQKVVLLLAIALLVFIHWDVRDGGMLSKIIYSRGGTFNQRNHLTVISAFFLTTVILAATNSFHNPLVILYCIPIVLSSLRMGSRMSIVYGFLLSIGLGIHYYLMWLVNGIVYSDAYLYTIMFVALAAATSLIANRLRRSAVDLSALYETGRALNSLLNAKEIMALILNIIMLDVQPDVAAIFLLDKKYQVLKIKAHRGFKGDISAWEEPLGRGLIGGSAERLSPILVSNSNRRTQLRKSPDLKSLIAVPIKVGDDLKGVLVVGKRNKHAFSFENVRFLEALSSQAAISLQNAGLYRRTQKWASLDGLTGIYNFRYFSERLEIEWNRAVRYEKPLSLIMIDADLFKNVNDTYGHLSGDKVLRDLSELLQQHIRETDVLSRYGGEEFTIILPETHYQDAYNVAEKLRQAVADNTFKTADAGIDIKLTISLGIANYPSTAFSRDDLIHQVDQTLYQAKKRRNTLASPLDDACDISIPSEVTE
ncbi:MAG TPA: GGDEF domain-containing protein [Actinobacteria bacterium]|nr:GGDEF domain-containing protein [Actinomycetes bacterium]HEX21368.1 GGDEF domain-containing protein [Actinomycetota bacterium]